MNSEMVIHAVGKPPKKVRERDGETPSTKSGSTASLPTM